MTRKMMVLGLAAVLVIAVAIPVVAQERVVTPKLQKISKRALKKSGQALRTARAAKRQARSAAADASDAQSTASDARSAAGAATNLAHSSNAIAEDAKTSADQTRAALAATRVQSGFAPDVVEAAAAEFVSHPGGPSVTVDVPASGLIEVWAQAAITGDGAVSLFEDGKPMPGQADFCSPDEDAGVLFSVGGNLGEPITMSTPAGGAVGLCGNLGAPAPVLFETTPGTHTYELRYASCGCEDPVEPASFTDRRLFVAPRP